MLEIPQAPTPEEKLAELAEPLGIRGPVAALWETMRHRLRAPRSLLHIENVDGATLADVAARLVRGLEGCAVLVSGRYQGLGRAAGWAEVSVKPLGPEDSLAQLIAEHRAPSTAAEEQEFRSLVRRLDGLPLAIHLCAGQLRRRLSVKRFLERLDRTVLDLEAPPGDPRTETRERTVLRASFALSMEQLKDQFGIEGEPLTRALAGLGHAVPSGVGLNLAASLCGLPMDDCEQLLIGAVDLSLLEPEFDENRADGVWRIHPLLAEFLRQRPQPECGGFVGMTQWFLSRLPRPGGAQAEQQGQCWNEINAERGSLVSWLERVPPEQIATVERAGSWFAMLCGPFAAWAALCERGLAGTTDDGTRSNLLWTLSRVLLTSGELDRAHARSLEKAQIDTGRNARHEAALAQGTVAEILHERGQPDEALRICREECLPVYRELGDIGEQAVTLGQIADILRERGQQDEALRILEKECKPAFEKRGDTLSLALTMGKIAHIYQMRGQLDQALHILEKECKPAFEKLGDIRSRAVTMSHIADILFARGQLDAALRIRLKEQLPVYEKLGEVRSWAATMGQIADILQARGQLDQALHTRREECLPVYEKLGDILSRAVTMGKIADIYRARGQLDDAMQIHCEEELPVYEKIGNIRERAVAMGKIADILNMRGKPDEALRIRREEQLPVFEKLGDVRSWAATMGKIADIYVARGQFDEALRILQEECKPAFEKLGDIRSRAATMGNIADILKVRGQLDDAIRLYRQEELPVYEKLEARHELLVGRTKLAVALRQRGAHDDKQEARSLLLLALHDAQELRLPEAAKIERLLARDVDAPPV